MAAAATAQPPLSVSHQLRALFYVLSPNESSFRSIQEVPDYVNAVSARSRCRPSLARLVGRTDARPENGSARARVVLLRIIIIIMGLSRSRGREVVRSGPGGGGGGTSNTTRVRRASFPHAVSPNHKIPLGRWVGGCVRGLCVPWEWAGRWRLTHE